MRKPKSAYSYPKPGTYKNGVAVGALNPVKRGRPRKAAGKAEQGEGRAFQRMLEQEAILYDLMENHRVNGEEVLAQAAFDKWTKMAVAIGSGETRDLKNRMHSGELVVAAKVDDATKRLFAYLPDHMRTGLRDMRKNFPGPPAAAVWDELVDVMVDEFFRSLPEKLPME